MRASLLAATTTAPVRPPLLLRRHQRGAAANSSSSLVAVTVSASATTAAGLARGTSSSSSSARCSSLGGSSSRPAGSSSYISTSTSRAQPVARAYTLQLHGFAEREGRYKKAPRRVEARAAQQAVFKRGQALLLEDPRVLKADLQSGRKQFAKGLNSVMQQFVKWAEEDSAAREAVDRVARTVQRVGTVKASRVIVAGSLGRGTDVTGAHDVDLLFFIHEWKNGIDLSTLAAWGDEAQMARVRREVKDALQRAQPSWRVEILNLAHYRNVLQVTLGGVKVDLLLLPDCAKGATLPQDAWALQQLQQLMRPAVFAHPDAAAYDQLRERATSPALNELLAAMPAEVKEVVRFVKGLYKLGLAPQEAERIRSFSLEVLVLAAHQQCQQTRWRRGLSANDYKLELFLDFLRRVVAAARERQVIMVDAGMWGYRREAGEQFAHCWKGGDGTPDAIRIIHPCDPTCNLERGRVHRGASDWTTLVEMAEELLELLLGGQRGTVPVVVKALARVQVSSSSGGSSSGGAGGSSSSSSDCSSNAGGGHGGGAGAADGGWDTLNRGVGW
ncbi:hypothetical protein HYH02_014183 [Chlamydomonas schloesseri]|uniref:Uncharacterized protein n=1 Tax=Chlamydomonas schloesseri TaxID=2026947 RepID=A0A835VTX5_9CHLO|nr:hypothetical protein HYH02_014183 [Chlamydomonas schloesseri]|eukprot:KAG2429147.1 hypothetical protein HYH02_014183 [Chlamydomonas schloesseri]